MTAVIVTGGKQYKVSEGDIIYVEKLGIDEGETVNFENVITVFDGDKVKLGSPTVAGVIVSGKIVKNDRAKKITVIKMHAKKNYRRKQGHRQPYSKVQIEKIVLG